MQARYFLRENPARGHGVPVCCEFFLPDLWSVMVVITLLRHEQGIVQNKTVTTIMGRPGDMLQLGLDTIVKLSWAANKNFKLILVWVN